MNKYLFDASAILNILRKFGEDALSIFENNYTITLAFYELGNAIWKDAVVLKKITPIDSETLFDTIFSLMEKSLNVITPRSWKRVLEVAEKLALTYYDSSYVVSAFENCLTFVTDDLKVLSAIKKYSKFLNSMFPSCIQAITTKNL